MIKKDELKKIIIPSLIFILLCNIIFFIVLFYQKKIYKKTINTSIAGIIDEILLEYPNVSEEKIVQLLNGKYNKDISTKLKQYGYLENTMYLDKLDKKIDNAIKVNLIVLSLFILSGVFIILIIYRRHNKKINEIDEYFKQLNNKNYELKIEDNGEDELSKLRNQLYKTTILLK